MTWKGTVIEEGLEDKTILTRAKIVDTSSSYLTNETDRGKLTFHKIEVADKRKAAFVKATAETIKERFFLRLCRDDQMAIVFRQKIFEFAATETDKLEAAREYGVAHGILREQMGFGTK